MQIQQMVALSVLAFLPVVVGAQSATTNGTAPRSMIVPYPAGGPSDLTARIISMPLSNELKATVVVENIGGASGVIAAQKLLNAPADGRLFYQGSQNELILPPLTIASTPFKPSDVQIVHPVTKTSLVLVVRSELPVQNLADFVEVSRRKSASEPLSYGSPGTGSLYHLITDSMSKMAKVSYTHVPYKGSAPLVQDLIGNRIDFTVMAFSTTMLPLMKAGRYKIIANLSKDRPRDLADLPSVSDLPVFQGVDYSSISGYFVKRGTSPEVLQALNDALGRVVASPEVIRALEDDGRKVFKRTSLTEAESMYSGEIARYTDIVKLTGFKPLD
jgi:tripartite-type tricarboxylate transporter receptor subunit TctC